MSGHNKWSKVKNVKGKEDAKKAKIFTKMSRYIMVAVRSGGADPEYNASLKMAIERAKAENMPNENIKRAIKKGIGGADGQNFENIVYEGYGPGGVAVVVECLTDNKNRTASDVRYAFDRYGGNLGTPGSVTFQFDYKGILVTGKEDKDADQVLVDALDAGAEDVQENEDIFIITTAPSDYEKVHDLMKEQGYEFSTAQVGYLPKNTVKLETEDQRQNVEDLFDTLEDYDDVQEVYSNWED